MDREGRPLWSEKSRNLQGNVVKAWLKALPAGNFFSVPIPKSPHCHDGPIVHWHQSVSLPIISSCSKHVHPSSPFFSTITLMLPIANFHVHDSDLCETSVEFFALRSPALSFKGFTRDDKADIGLDDDSRLHTFTPVQLRVDKLTRGRASRRRKADANSVERRQASNGACSPQSRPDPPASMVASVRSELDVTRNELAKSQAEAFRLTDRCKVLERALKDITDTLRAREKEVDDLKKRKRADEERKREAVGGSSSSSSSNKDVHGHEKDLDEKRYLRSRSPFPSRRHKSTPPAPRTVVGAVLLSKDQEIFLTKTDSWSGAQVLEAVHDLNSEILQLAAAAADLTGTEKRTNYPGPKIVQAAKETASRLGGTFARLLATRDHTQDPMLIQFALQASVATCAARMLSAFCIGLSLMPNELFAQLYLHMHSIEPQATSSRWRALTLSHIRAMNPRLEELAVSEFVDNIIRSYADIFTLCGCTNTEVDLTSVDALQTRFGSQIWRIAQSACDLARVTKEGIMSTNFEVILVEQGRIFDAVAMTNAFAGFGASKGAVLCTTELGLRCSTRRNARAVAHRLGGAETIERTTLLQPKVILEAVAQIFEPARVDYRLAWLLIAVDKSLPMLYLCNMARAAMGVQVWNPRRTSSEFGSATSFYGHFVPVVFHRMPDCDQCSPQERRTCHDPPANGLPVPCAASLMGYLAPTLGHQRTKGDQELPMVDVLSWLGRVMLDVISEAGFSYHFDMLTDTTNELAFVFAIIFSTIHKFRVMTILQVSIVPTHSVLLSHFPASVIAPVQPDIAERARDEA
ncbi:hypothetical protein EW146_g4824 [Bondarzewia mesenterica]|uniref:Uncharacterized protein n=1 Tax=Bondarzewia mesenterica TaxID=1095465 RepID=A0A4S4LTD7_9AGAM|nr:hypothetical protein EW146_g4824 [Bondarzewia mesenterica]